MSLKGARGLRALRLSAAACVFTLFLLATPHINAQGCVGAYVQCYGSSNGFTGPKKTCCTSGYSCQSVDPTYYWQCRPGTGPSPTPPSPAPPTPPTKPPTKAPSKAPSSPTNPAPAPTPSQPTPAGALNIVVILSDDLGWGEVSALNPGQQFRTPNLDALAASGMLFTSGYANPVCAPSRASLVLGKHTGHSPIRGNTGPDTPLADGDTTFMQVLQRAGYQTACVGKWGLGWADSTGAPWKKGCAKYYGQIDQGGAHLYYPNTGSGGSITSYSASAGQQTVSIPENAGATRSRCQAAGNNCKWSSDLYKTSVLAELDSQAARQAQEKAAGQTPKPFMILFGDTVPHPGNWAFGTPAGQPVPGTGPFAGQGWADVDKDHASAVQEYHDKAIGQIVAKISSLGLRGSTAIFYISDNGPWNDEGTTHRASFFKSAGPFTGYKRWLHEGGIRVPFISSLPGKFVAGARSDTPVAIWDIAPTVLSLAGIPSSQWPGGMDGYNLYPELLAKGAPSAAYAHPPLYWEFCTSYRVSYVNRSGKGWSRAVRDGKWKGIWFFYSGFWSGLQLFDLSVDPGETTSVSAANPDIVARLTNFANSAHTDSSRFPRSDTDCVGG